MITSFYIYGYDPRVGRFYTKHIRDKLAEELAIEGDPRARALTIDVNRQEHRISVPARGEDEAAQVIIPSWSKIIYDTITRNRLLLVYRYNVIIIKSVLDGSFFRYFQTSWKFTSAVTFFFLFPVALGLILAVGFLLVSPSGGWLHILIAVLLFGAVFVSVWTYLLGFQFMRYLFWSICFVGDLGGTSGRLRKHLPEFEAKLDEMAMRIADVRTRSEPDDIVTVIGHSSGAILAMAVAARLSRSTEFLASGRKVRLLTMGGTWGILALGAGARARQHRQEILEVLRCDRLTWYDVAGGEDIITVPYTYRKLEKLLRVDQVDHRDRLNYVDPLYPTLFEPDFYRKNMRNFLLLHFQYIDQPHNRTSFNLFRLMLNRWQRIEGDGKIS